MFYLGTLSANAGVGVNNHSTAAPFDIPNAAKELYLESDIDSIACGIGAGSGTNYDTFSVTVTSGIRLYSNNDPYFVQELLPVPQIGKSDYLAEPAWADLTSYAVGDLVSANGQIYICTHAGTSTSDIYSLGPSNIGAVLGDGTVNWAWRGPSNAAATPDKTIVRIAIFNPTASNCNVKVWIAS
jgi:hypothetical protein